MQFQDAIRSGFRNYVGFSGRAPRSEFWYWQLFVVLVAVAASILDSGFLPESDVGPISAVTSLALLLPGIAMAIRRLHDIDRTGWWVLLALTLIGAILLIVWACFKGTNGSNRFGPDPVAGAP
jgi:uncharacterized membrane protein YhaH (DUF805 family)